jgi:hypothetical protein
MKIIQKKQANFERRRARIRAKVNGTADASALAIFKSHKLHLRPDHRRHQGPYAGIG